MLELTPNQLIPLMTDLLKQPRAILLVGAPGMAKTETVRQAAKRLGAALLVEHPLLREPVDYAGLPWVHANGHGPEVLQLPMAFVRAVTDLAERDPQRPVVVFFDDVGQATAATQAALMQFVQERSFAGQQIPDNVRFVLATNRRKDKAGVGGILAPLTNRLTVLGVTVDPDSWAEWAHTAGLPAVLPAYVRFKPDCLRDPETLSNRDIEPFCSARALEALGRYLQAGISERAVVAGCVGDARATEISAFLKVWQELPDVDDILKRPTKADVPKRDRPDILYALIGSLATHATEKRMKPMADYVRRLPPEFRVAFLKDAVTQHADLARDGAFMGLLMEHKALMGVGAA